MTKLETLRLELELLNESIYEPEDRISAAERARRIRERDRVWERIEELENEDDT
jgi:hypothetical protein